MRLLILGFVLLLAACSSGSSDEPRLGTKPTLHTAEKALSAGDAALAMKIALSLQGPEPTDPDILAVVGNAALELGRTGQATLSYQQALKHDSANLRALLGLGRVQLMSDPARAEEYFERVLANDPRNAAALNDMGIANDLQNHHADAQAFYRKSLALQPDNSATMVNLGLSLAKGGDREGARRVLQPLLADPAAMARTRQNLAKALTAAGDPDGAARVLNQDAATSVEAP